MARFEHSHVTAAVQVNSGWSERVSCVHPGVDAIFFLLLVLALLVLLLLSKRQSCVRSPVFRSVSQVKSAAFFVCSFPRAMILFLTLSSYHKGTVPVHVSSLEPVASWVIMKCSVSSSSCVGLSMQASLLPAAAVQAGCPGGAVG